MPVETTITASPDLSRALEALKPAVMLRAVGRGMGRGTLLIVGHIQRTRLSGKGPFPVADHRLGIVTGRLRKAVRGTEAKISGDTVKTSIGTNVSYAAVHEFGFTGTVNVKAHEVNMKKLFGSRLKTPLRFSRLASQRKVHIPERRPFRTGIEENLPLLEREITREVVNTIRGGGIL